MRVRLADGRLVTVDQVKIRELDHPEPTYNLEVDGDHNYYVGNHHVLVHNGPPLDEPGHWNYVLKDKASRTYYHGRAGPNETVADVNYRHEIRSRPGYSGPGASPGRFVPANKDRLVPLKGERVYGASRRVEHEGIIRDGTFIGKNADHYRGNRQRGIGPPNGARYYPKGNYPECP